MTTRRGHDVRWIDGRRWPRHPANPYFPHGIDLDFAGDKPPSCIVQLPYPAKRCGQYAIECRDCGLRVLVSTAGRADDPRSVRLACAIELTRFH